MKIVVNPFSLVLMYQGCSLRDQVLYCVASMQPLATRLSISWLPELHLELPQILKTPRAFLGRVVWFASIKLSRNHGNPGMRL